MHKCSLCDYKTDSKHGLNIHKSTKHKRPWQDKKRLKELYIVQELSTREVADRFGTKSTTISYWLDKHGIDARSRAVSNGGVDFTSEELYKWYHEDGMSTTEIGEMLGIDSSNVYRWLDKHNIDTKSRSDYEYPSGEEHHWWSGGRKTYQCDNCNEDIKRYPKYVESHENIYCDVDCRSEAWTKEASFECEWCGGEYTTWPYREGETRFCTKECRYEWLSNGKDYTKHPNYRGQHGDYCGPKWDEKRQQRLEIDGYKCGACGMDEKEHNEKYGNGLHVHHIKPRSDFWENGEINWGEANDMGNLITLCLMCHRKWEGIPLKPQ